MTNSQALSEANQLSLITEQDTDIPNDGIYVCLDIETTGFSNDDDDIIEVAAVKFNLEGEIDRMSTLIHSTTPIPIIVQDLTGIKNEMLIDQPKIETIKADLLEFCGNHPIIGHNINFDLNFLDKNDIVIPGKRIDTFPISQMLVKNAVSYSLETLSHHFAGHQPTHRALDDVLANIELFKYLLELWQKYQTPDCKTILQKSNLPFGFILEAIEPNSNIELSKPELPPIPNSFNLNQELQEKINNLDSKTLIVGTNDQIKTINQETGYPIIPPYFEQINQTKFTQLLNKEELEENEAIAALKISIATTDKLPSLSDLKLFGPDYTSARKLTSSKPEPLPESSKPQLINHDYFFKLLTNSQLNFEEYQILFFDHPFLEESFVRASTTYIHHNDFPETADIAFGILGIFWEKYQKNPENNLLILEDYHLQTPQWQKVKDAFANLDIDLPTDSNYLYWLTCRNESVPTIQYMPISGSYSNQKLITDYKLNLEVLPFATDLKTHLTYFSDLPVSSKPNYKQELNNKLAELIPEYKKDICILTTSHDQIKNIYKFCLKEFPHRGTIAQKISGSAGKITHKINEQDDHNILICTYQFYLKHKPQLPNLENLILAKLPIITPNHPYYKYREQTDKNHFMDCVIPYTIKNLLQTIHTGREADHITLLDSRISSTSYGKVIKEQLSKSISFQ